MTSFPRILIVGTLPYNPNESSRALDTYFHNWPKENLRMIFSNTNIPMKGHCGALYQITDYDVLQVFKKKTNKCGRVIEYSDLKENEVINKSDNLTKFKRKTILRYYARKTLWNKKRWLTKELIDWVDEFKPEAVYICFSDDYFILDIADYFLSKYNIPVIAQIGDDYYFKKQSMLLRPYLCKYKKLFNKIMNYDGFGVYISEKLSKKYNDFFKLQGEPFYLSSSIEREENSIKNEFNYIGKVALGRDKSLAILGDILFKVNPEFSVNIYTQDKVSSSLIRYWQKHNCSFKGSVDYRNAIQIMNSGSFNIVASGFRKKDINESRYSLSTKVADSLASSGPIIATGSKGDGAIDFFSQHDCSILIDTKCPNIENISRQIYNRNTLVEKINKAHNVFDNLFIVEKNRSRFEENCRKIVYK